MVYDYYCVDCGRQFKAANIMFDLGELTGLRHLLIQEDFDNIDRYDTKLGLVSAYSLLQKVVNERIKNDGFESLDHREVEIEYNLSEYLQIMAKNYGRGNMEYRNLAEKLRMSDLRKDQRSNLLCDLLGLNREDPGTPAEIRFFVDQACSIFKNMGQRDEQDLEKYVCRFHVVPEYFEDKKAGIYTLKYRNKINTGLTDITYYDRIRGYCPECGSPILEGSGRDMHILVGLLGAQAAGKTSTIMALLETMKEHFDNLDIEYPTIPLGERRFKSARRNLNLYENGWAVEKTNISTHSTFNASLLLKSSKHNVPEKLVTFIDIAGELLYDRDRGGVKIEKALEDYPLIDKCNLYIVCSCTTGTEGADVPPDAIIAIAKGIFGKIERKPPMCITLTKTDQFKRNIGYEQDKVAEQLFAEILPSDNYEYSSHLENLKIECKSNPDDSVLESLKWCYKTYKAFENLTYVTMINTRAYGFPAKKYDGKPGQIQLSDDGRPKPENIEELWKWVLKNIGLISTSQGYLFDQIPIRSYKPINGNHYQAIRSQFLNPGPDPEKLKERRGNENKSWFEKLLSWWR